MARFIREDWVGRSPGVRGKSLMPLGSAVGRIAPMLLGVSSASELVERARTTTENAKSGQVENGHWNATYTLRTAARCLGDLRLLGRFGRR